MLSINPDSFLKHFIKQVFIVEKLLKIQKIDLFAKSFSKTLHEFVIL